MFGNTGPFSYSPRGFSPDDLPQQRRGFQHEEPRNAAWQKNSTARPSGRSIYSQRKEHIETLNKQADRIHYRVEHLFTCELDGHEASSLEDCVAKLKRLDTKGQLWPQEMILEVQGGYLQLNDIETKAELESLALGCILQTKAVLDSCAYNSLLTVTVQERNRFNPQVFMFQCEEVGAEHIKSDLDKVVQGKTADVAKRSDQINIRNNLENIIGQRVPGSVLNPGPRDVQDRTPSPAEDPLRHWNRRDFETIPPPQMYAAPQDESQHNAEFDMSQFRQEAPAPIEYTEIDRDTDILNHVLNDIEIFMWKVTAVTSSETNKVTSKKKKKIFQKKGNQKKAPAASLPPEEEYVSYLQKVKYAFNLLGKLDGMLTNPSAPDFVHIVFSCLQIGVPRYSSAIPLRVLSPMLTELALLLLDQSVSPEEDHLWRSLGECWNVPRSKWPDGDMIPPYMPEFYDGWQIPPKPAPPLSQSGAISHSQRFPPSFHDGRVESSQNYPGRDRQGPPEAPMTNTSWASPPPTRASEPPLYMRVIYDFMARNNQELCVMKGDVVQVVDKSKQWWLVRNNCEEEGHVPQNVLEPMNEAVPMEKPQGSRGAPPLDMMSNSADVRAWLEYKGFSKITVRSLGVLNGKLLLGMPRDDIRTVCPEEGSKVFFQLQPIKAAIALASEPGYGSYNGRY